MKKIVSLIVILAITVNVFAQSSKEVISEAFTKYFSYVQQKDNPKILDCIYPKLFDIVPKKKMLDAMNAAFSDTSIIITMDSSVINKISETVTDKGVQYVLLSYSFVMRMQIKPEEGDEPDAVKETINTTNEIFKEMYGADNVQVDDATNTIIIVTKNELFAILDPAFKSWKFLENKSNMKPIFNKLIPKKVATAFHIK